MSNELINTVYRNEADLVFSVKTLLDKGVDPNVITKYGESALRVASNNGRFDVIKLLISRGADESQLGWTDLFHTIAYANINKLKEEMTKDNDLEARDFWDRTPLLFSILVGDTQKTAMLVEAGADVNAVGRCAKPPLFYAIRKDNAAMLGWLLENGFDSEQCDQFSDTPLIVAAEQGATKCVELLIEKGVDIFKENGIPEQAISVASNLDIVKLLVTASADINDVNEEIRAEMLGYNIDENPDISAEEYHKGKRRVYGKSNPERAKNPFWQAMVKCGASAYHAASKFEPKRNIFKDEPVWCFERFGKSITPLDDGRFIEIGGEHEDHYDPDFCIYNDVIVHQGNGESEIYIYPRDVFQPTDFHTATLIDGYIYIIGNLGYPEDRRAGYTPVYRLDINTLKIDKVATSGEMPGWISRHKAYYDGETKITIKGGKLIVKKKGKEDYIDNHHVYSLCLNTMEWKKLSDN